MEFYSCSQDALDLATTTLVVPSISIGNIGQLAMDLVLENDSTGTRRIGHLYHPDILPVAGASLNASNILSLSVEVYMTADGRFTYIQQRAPCIAGRAGVVYRDFLQWVHRVGFKQLIILCGADATARVDDEIRDSTSAHYVTLSPDAFSGIVASAKPLNKRTVPDYQRTKQQADTVWDVHGGGYLARRAVKSWLQNDELKVCVVLVFGVEGDNIPESMLLASAFLQAYGHCGKNGRLHIPSSWSLIYGSERFDRELFM